VRQRLEAFLERNPSLPGVTGPVTEQGLTTRLGKYRTDRLRDLGAALWNAGLADELRQGDLDIGRLNLLTLSPSEVVPLLLRFAVDDAESRDLVRRFHLPGGDDTISRGDMAWAATARVAFSLLVPDFLANLAYVSADGFDAFAGAVTARVEAAIAAAEENTAPTIAPPAGNGTAATKEAKRQQRRRRRQAPRQAHPITPKQTEALQLVGEHKGNITAAAKQAGKSPAAMSKLYHKACRKLGEKASKAQKVKTQRLPHDRRGQVAVEGRGEEE
jgi:hypothetical protein